MKQIILVFVAQFSVTLLLGLQSLNVNGGHVYLAILTSALLGVFGYYVTSMIAATNISGMFSLLWWAFIIAGPCGIAVAIKTHPWLVRVLYRAGR